MTEEEFDAEKQDGDCGKCDVVDDEVVWLGCCGCYFCWDCLQRHEEKWG